MQKPLLFIPITKIDQEKRLVFGIATAEEKDRSGEICDYASTKPLYEKWSREIAQATDGKSFGNIRAMHGNVAAGKVITIAFNDEAKQIEICAKIIDDYEWKKVEEGVYTGFSQGGAYANRWTDDEGITRYTADPYEISLVDLPCLPSATFKVVKANGKIVEQAFKSLSPFETMISSEKIMKAKDIHEQGVCLKAEEENTIKKGLETCGRLALLIQDLESLQQELAVNTSVERNKSSIPDELSNNISSLCVTLRNMIGEKTDELMDDIGIDDGQEEQSLTLAATKLRYDSRLALAKIAGPSLKSILRRSESLKECKDQENIQKIHDMAILLGAKPGPQLIHSETFDDSNFNKLEKAIIDVAELSDTRQKIIEEQMFPMLREMADRLKSIEAQPRPLPFMNGTRAVSKIQDSGIREPIDLDEAFSQMGHEEREAFIFKHLLAQPKKMGCAPR